MSANGTILPARNELSGATPEASWFVVVDVGNGHVALHWTACLRVRDGGCVAKTPQCRSRAEVDAPLARIGRVAHVDDCIRRLDNDPLGLQFLLNDPTGPLPLIGTPQRTSLDRERALIVVKCVARVAAPALAPVAAAFDADPWSIAMQAGPVPS